jgi:hypothetical protein
MMMRKNSIHFLEAGNPVPYLYYLSDWFMTQFGRTHGVGDFGFLKIGAT